MKVGDKVKVVKIIKIFDTDDIEYLSTLINKEGVVETVVNSFSKCPYSVAIEESIAAFSEEELELV